MTFHLEVGGALWGYFLFGLRAALLTSLALEIERRGQDRCELLVGGHRAAVARDVPEVRWRKMAEKLPGVGRSLYKRAAMVAGGKAVVQVSV